MSYQYNSAILWDLDGTLLDTSKGSIASVQYTINTLHYPTLTETDLLSFIGPPVRYHLQKMFQLSEKEALHAMTIFREYYNTNELFNATIYDGIPEILNYLRTSGVFLGVATNKRTDMAYSILEHFYLADYFNVIEGSNTEGTLTKTNILNNCLSHCHAQHITSEHVIYVGDSPSDGLSAKEASIQFIGVTYGFGFKSRSEIAEIAKNYLCFSSAAALFAWIQKNI